MSHECGFDEKLQKSEHCPACDSQAETFSWFNLSGLMKQKDRTARLSEKMLFTMSITNDESECKIMELLVHSAKLRTDETDQEFLDIMKVQALLHLLELRLQREQNGILTKFYGTP